MQPTLLLAALDAVGKPHVAGHRCSDGKWYNDAAGTKSPCPVRLHLDTARDQAEKLHASVHEAAHDDASVRYVMQAMTGFTDDDLSQMPGDESWGWMHTTRLAIEGLSEYLDRDPVREARLAGLRNRLAEAGLSPDPEHVHPDTLPCLAGCPAYGTRQGPLAEEVEAP